MFSEGHVGAIRATGSRLGVEIARNKTQAKDLYKHTGILLAESEDKLANLPQQEVAVDREQRKLGNNHSNPDAASIFGRTALLMVSLTVETNI